MLKQTSIIYIATLIMCFVACKSNEEIVTTPVEIVQEAEASIFHKTRVIEGNVKSTLNEEIAEAVVSRMPSNKGTITDTEGYFKIRVDTSDALLRFSASGYAIQEIPIPSEGVLNIILEENATIEVPEGGLEEELMMADHAEVRRSRGAPSSTAPEMAAMSSKRAASSTTGVILRPDGTQQPTPEAGQITAGEWNDLNKWDDWTALLSNKDYSEMQEHWKLYPTARYTVFLRNQYEFPFQDIPVDLVNEKGEVVWTARTDNSGKAELWAGLTAPQKSLGSYKAIAIVNGLKFEIKKLTDIAHGVNNLDIKIACATPDAIDIVWAVDATGSMGDEIRYLQKELDDVIKRSKKSVNKLTLRMGAVFYRDTQDDYLTRTSQLDTDIDKTLSFIAAQSAGGGGDYPEAVESALEDALAQDWSPKAVARIIFLVLDAPPHEDPDIITQLQEQIKEAAARGIKIIPITASGINRQTEFLMKYMAIATNGTYVFITDHSGIGSAHLDPVVQDYEVEKLNDLLVRLLSYYTQSNGCDANEFPKRNITLYPNPTSNFVTVKTPDPLMKIEIRGASGKLILSKNDISAGEERIELAGLVDGVYTIRCMAEDYEYSQPLIIVSGR
ncbi:MAG: hypothetical protein ACJA01_004005 [Saprospiraceae bacterium]|jgi:hypothetical protein